MKTNRYFWASVVSSLFIILGLVGLVIKGVTPAYSELLRLCGFAVGPCQAVMSQLNPVSIFAAGALIWMGVVLIWQFVKTYLVLKRVSSRSWPVPNYLRSMSYKVGIANRIKVVDGAVLFCSGLVRPQIIVGREILKNLTDRELEAALTHESFHLKNYDPLKVYLATGLARAFFFLPAISALTHLYLKEKELAADSLAESKIGRVYLAKALYKVLEKTNPSSSVSPALVPSFASFQDFRMGGRLSNISSWTWAGTLVVLITLSFSLVRIGQVGVGGCS